MSATGSGDQQGFTLIECLAVLAITALASAIAFPSIEQAMGATEIVQSREALAANLEQARARALADGRPQILVIAPDGGAYSWGGAFTRGLPPGVRLSEEAAAPVAFFPDGSASPGRLTLSSGARRAVVATSSTGMVFTDTPPKPAPAP